MKNKIKILFLAGFDNNNSKTEYEKEFNAIQDKLNQRNNSEHFSIKPLFKFTREDLFQAIINEEFNIIHFCGHSTRLGNIYITSSDGKSELIKPQGFAKLLINFKDEIKCVILNSCYSENIAKHLESELDYVISFPEDLENDLAINFSIGFYLALVANNSIKKSFKLSMAFIELKSLHHYPQLGGKDIIEKPQLIPLFGSSEETDELKGKLDSVEGLMQNKEDNLQASKDDVIAYSDYKDITIWIENHKKGLIERIILDNLQDYKKDDKEIFEEEMLFLIEELINSILLETDSVLDFPEILPDYPEPCYKRGFKFIIDTINNLPEKRISQESKEIFYKHCKYLLTQLQFQ